MVEQVLDDHDLAPRFRNDHLLSECPCCHERTLRVSERPGHSIEVMCYRACKRADVLAALGLTRTDLFPREEAIR